MSETILIIGDSWAATGHSMPSSGNPVNTLDPSEDLYNLDINFQLKGYEVVNKSWWGAANSDTLASSLLYLKYRPKTLPKIKLIVFLFTELLREVDFKWPPNLRFLPIPKNRSIPISKKEKYGEGVPLTFEEILEVSYQYQKKYVDAIRELCPDVPWAVIGGHAPLYKPEDWQWADFVKEDWKSELAGQKVPACHSLGIEDWIESAFDLDIRERELKLKLEILNIMERLRHIFPDSIHPNITYHDGLAKEIINHFDL